MRVVIPGEWDDGGRRVTILTRSLTWTCGLSVQACPDQRARSAFGVSNPWIRRWYRVQGSRSSVDVADETFSAFVPRLVLALMVQLFPAG